jgi:hypothetical protein
LAHESGTDDADADGPILISRPFNAVSTIHIVFLLRRSTHP